MLFNRSVFAQRLGVSGLYLFAISGGLSAGGVYAGLVAMLLALILVADQAWSRLRHEPVFLVALALSLYVVISGFANLPSDAWHADYKTLRRIGDLVAIAGLFTVATAWWLAGDNKRIGLTLQLALLGLLVGVLKGVDWQQLTTYFRHRPLFGMGNGAGLYALVVMIGLLTLRASRLFEGAWQRRRLLPLANKLGVFLVFAFFTAVVLLSQTRAVWLAAVVVLPAAIWLKLKKKARETQRRWVVGFELLLLAVLVVGVTLGAGTVEQRLGREGASLVLLLSGEARELPADSIGLRVRLWENAWQQVSAHPWFGRGAGSATRLIRESGLPSGLTHYHNLYLQFAVELGAVGLGLFALLTLGLARAGWNSWRRRQVDTDYLLFLAAVLAVFLITASFQIRHDDERGQALLILLGALALTHRLRGQQATPG